MSTSEHNLSDYSEKNIPNAGTYRFGIAVSDYNPDITLQLLKGCHETLEKHGATDIKTIHVPGSYELVAGAVMLLEKGPYDAIICLGCVIKGDTDHDRYINQAVANGIANLNIQYKKPVIFGVLTPNNHKQAIERSGGKHGNKGVEAAITAIQMVYLSRKIQS